MSVKRTPGRVVWRELMTGDVAKAKAFYGELFGWSFTEMPMGEGAPPYTLARIGDKPVAGVMAPQDGGQTPPFWLSYVSVEDVDAAAQRVLAQGGAVMMPPTDIPQAGRIAIVADFAGAAFGLLTSKSDDPPPAMPKPSEPCWETISSADLDRARTFYTGVLGWALQEMNGGTVFAVGPAMEDTVADLQKAEGMPSMWATYVVVDTVERAREKAESLGARTVVPLIEIPNVGRIGFIADPTGAHIGLYQPQD